MKFRWIWGSWGLMKVQVALALAFACVISPGAQSDGQSDSPVAGGEVKPPELTIEEWIGRLGDDSYEERERASAALWQRGEEALKALQHALLSDDPEVVLRARELADKIDFGILPDTPSSVLDLVDAYAKADNRTKSTALFQLRRLEAWRPMLKLYARETDPTVRQELRQVIEGVAVIAAREEVVAGRLPMALEYLEMAPADAKGLAAWASFHAACGTAAAELRRVRKMEGRVGALHRMALKRAMGDVDGAIAEAEAAGERRIVAALSLLRGDPLPWLRLPSRDRFRTFFHETYRRWAIDRWQTGEADPEIIESMLRAVDKGDDDDRLTGLSALMLAGHHDPAAERMARLMPSKGFAHYDAVERVDDALRVFGIDPEEPDFRGWSAKKIGKILADLDESDEEQEQVIQICAFLEARGMVDEASACLEPWIVGLAENFDDEGDAGELFLKVVDQLMAGGVVEAALRAVADWAGEDEGRWEEVATNLLGPGKDNHELLIWLGEEQQGLKGKQRMWAMLAMRGVLQGEEGLRRKWTARLHAAAKKAEGVERGRLYGLFCDVSLAAGDLESSIEALRELGKDEAEHPRFRDYILVLAAAGEWLEVAELWRKELEGSPRRPSTQAYLAASLRKAGRENEARDIESLIEKLVMGDAGTAVKVAGAYLFTGDFKRAGAWQRRALMEGDPEPEGWVLVVQALKTTLMEDAEWTVAAALGEVLAVIALEREMIYEEVPLMKLRSRFEADFARAMSLMEENRESALEMLGQCHSNLPSDGLIADYFLPALRNAGLRAEHDRYFEAAWQRLGGVIEKYPGSHNTRNTAAWIAARAVRRLDEAQRHLDHAFTIRPRQAAYLDTMAELCFARRDRQKALEWSSRAVANDLGDVMLLRQFERFRAGKFPVR